MFSVCIPTIDRYNEFLSKSIPKYMANALISEIIICDENGNDASKIREAFPKESKLKVVVNEVRLGPMMNKMKVGKLATNNWVVILDSDNFADYDYFETCKNYIEKNSFNIDSIVLSPSFASPNFDYNRFSTSYITKKTINKDHITLMNTHNYVINKHLIHNINLDDHMLEVGKMSPYDTIYFNVMLFEQFPDLQFHVIPNMKYDHVIHNGSIFIQTSHLFSQFYNYIINRFNNLSK